MLTFRWPENNSLPAVEIRALSYDHEVWQRDHPEVMGKKMFCSQVPADMSHSDSLKELSQDAEEGDIRPLKIFTGPENHKSSEYGFDSFVNKEAAQRELAKAESVN